MHPSSLDYSLYLSEDIEHGLEQEFERPLSDCPNFYTLFRLFFGNGGRSSRLFVHDHLKASLQVVGSKGPTIPIGVELPRFRIGKDGTGITVGIIDEQKAALLDVSRTRFGQQTRAHGDEQIEQLTVIIATVIVITGILQSKPRNAVSGVYVAAMEFVIGLLLVNLVGINVFFHNIIVGVVKRCYSFFIIHKGYLGKEEGGRQVAMTSGIKYSLGIIEK